MSDYPQTGSTLTGAISTGLSTQIIIKVNGVAVGAIQSISPQQNRSAKEIGEVGLDGWLEIVPNAPTKYSVDVTRVVFDKKRMTEAFGRGFINIKSQMVPFDIDIIDRSNGGEGTVTTLVNCWFTRYQPTYTSSDFVISEMANIIFEDVRTVFGGSDKFAAQGGIKPTEYSTGGSSAEQDADSGSRRGTMDLIGLSRITEAAFTE